MFNISFCWKKGGALSFCDSLFFPFWCRGCPKVLSCSYRENLNKVTRKWLWLNVSGEKSRYLLYFFSGYGMWQYDGYGWYLLHGFGRIWVMDLGDLGVGQWVIDFRQTVWQNEYEYDLEVMWIHGGFLKWRYLQIIHFNRMVHSKPSILWGFMGFPPYLEIWWPYPSRQGLLNACASARQWQRCIVQCSEATKDQPGKSPKEMEVLKSKSTIRLINRGYIIQFHLEHEPIRSHYWNPLLWWACWLW